MRELVRLVRWALYSDQVSIVSFVSKCLVWMLRWSLMPRDIRVAYIYAILRMEIVVGFFSTCTGDGASL